MQDLLNLISQHAAEPRLLHRAIVDHRRAVEAAAGRGNRRLVHEAEQGVRRGPEKAFSFDSEGFATLTAAGQHWQAGRFETVSIDDLRARCQRKNGQHGGRATFHVLDGVDPVVDIGSLQANASPGTLFQVASQFNCLESPGPYLANVADYFHDSTQGPRASISAFPATLLRHYAAPGVGGQHFTQQSNGPQLELLSDAMGRGSAPFGYLNGVGIARKKAAVETLESNFGQIRIGLHEKAEVVLGGNWDGAVESGPRFIAQAFTSTIAGGGYGGQTAFDADGFLKAAGCLLRAAYLGTLLGAAALGCRRVVLTLIGGGVFRNPTELIFDAIRWALDEADPLLPASTEVFLNGFNLGSNIDLDRDLLPTVRSRGGVLWQAA